MATSPTRKLRPSEEPVSADWRAWPSSPTLTPGYRARSPGRNRSPVWSRTSAALTFAESRSPWTVTERRPLMR